MQVINSIKNSFMIVKFNSGNLLCSEELDIQLYLLLFHHFIF